MPEFSDEDVQKIRQMQRKLRNIRAKGIALQVDNESITIGPVLQKRGSSVSDDSPQLQARVKATTWSDAGSTALAQTMYRGRIVTANVASLNPTVAPTDSGIYTDGSTDVLLYNEVEAGLTERLIDPSGPAVTFAVVPLGTITASGTFQGVAVYAILGLQPTLCS